jgi:hypothetical protein
VWGIFAKSDNRRKMKTFIPAIAINMTPNISNDIRDIARFHIRCE